jgi:hypothetical protein
MNWIEQLYHIPKWKKYSQCNEECYLEHILKALPDGNKTLVELGAWDGYHLSNTRYFIEQGYKAILIDGDNKGNEEVKQHFITRDNVVELLKKYQTPKIFDLFCIDLDGNDIYILEEVLKNYKPNVIIAEYNPIFQPNESYAIKYNPEHTWSEDDYYGFSFEAGMILSKLYGYTCIFQNDNLNMYFVENSILAFSLGVSATELSQHIPKVTYESKVYHPKSAKTDWIKY